MFYDIVNQIAEFDGEEPMDIIDKKEKAEKTNQKNAQLEEALSVELKGKCLEIFHHNITNVTINIYVVDLEVLFTACPFLSSANDDF